MVIDTTKIGGRIIAEKIYFGNEQYRGTLWLKNWSLLGKRMKAKENSRKTKIWEQPRAKWEITVETPNQKRSFMCKEGSLQQNKCNGMLLQIFAFSWYNSITSIFNDKMKYRNNKWTIRRHLQTKRIIRHTKKVKVPTDNIG